jgi:predicted transcriptional regulator
MSPKRPPESRSKPAFFRLAPSVVAQMDVIAEATDRSRAYVANELIKEALAARAAKDKRKDTPNGVS